MTYRRLGHFFERHTESALGVQLRHDWLNPACTMSKSTTLWNGEVGYRLSLRARIVMEAFNIFDAEVSDIDYFYTSRLPGEPAEGVDGIHTHPTLPRSARVGIQLSF